MNPCRRCIDRVAAQMYGHWPIFRQVTHSRSSGNDGVRSEWLRQRSDHSRFFMRGNLKQEIQY